MKIKKYLRIYLFCFSIYLITPLLIPEPAFAGNISINSLNRGINLKVNNLNIFALNKNRTMRRLRYGRSNNGRPVSGGFAKNLIILILAFVAIVVFISFSKKRNKPAN
jgi:hypothetical protein